MAKALQLKESDLREQIRDLCKVFGWKFHFTWLAIHSPKGFPDLVLRRPPRLIFAELKSDKGQLTPSQEDWITDLKACKQEVYVWRPKDFDTIVDILR